MNTPNNLETFFSSCIEPAFAGMGWEPPEINALRGAFFMGAKFGVENEEIGDEIMHEVEAFNDRIDASPSH